MNDRLGPYLRLKAATDDELWEAYRKIYIETYVETPDGDEVELFWDGKRVRFYAHPKSFRKAFSESSDYRFSDGSHDIPISKKRLRRILWIKEILSSDICTIEIRTHTKKDRRNRLIRRIELIVQEENYIVVLVVNRETGEYDFLTAFPPDAQYLRHIRQRSTLLSIKNPSLSGD